MFWMLHSQISQFPWHIFYVTLFWLKFVMDALFPDFSSWQTTYRGICNVTVLESDISTHTVYHAIVENWHGMHCNDIIAHVHKTALIEQPTCIFMRFSVLWPVCYRNSNTHVLVHPNLSKVYGQEVTSAFPLCVTYNRALHALCRIQQQRKK
jgi:hypothetical protein